MLELCGARGGGGGSGGGGAGGGGDGSGRAAVTMVGGFIVLSARYICPYTLTYNCCYGHTLAIVFENL